MAEEAAAVETPDEDEAFERWLNEDEDGEEDMQEVVEAEHAKEDDRALKTAMETKRMVAKKFREEKVDKKIDAFMAEASETEKRLFAIYRKADMDDKQIDGLIELVKVKTTEAETDEEADEVEEKAAELAQQMVGAGPLRQGARIKPDKEAELMERIAMGDVNALVDAVVGDNVPW